MRNFINAVAEFHKSEDGEQAVSNVAILAVGATVLLGLLTIWGTVKTETSTLIGKVLKGGK